jgi:hypothetical protein
VLLQVASATQIPPLMLLVRPYYCSDTFRLLRSLVMSPFDYPLSLRLDAKLSVVHGNYSFVFHANYLYLVYQIYWRYSSTLLLQPVGTNVIVEKRSLMARSVENLRRLHPSTLLHFVKRQSETSPDSATTLKGIQRVAYRADIEQTNFFMTGYAFFIVLIVGSAWGTLFHKNV